MGPGNDESVRVGGAAHDGAVARVPTWLAVAGGASWRLLAIAALAWVVIEILGRVRVVAIPLAIAVVLSALLSPLARWLRARHAPRFVASGVPLLLVIGVIGAVVALFVRGISRQWTALEEAIRSGWEDLVRLIGEAPLGIEAGQLTERLQDGIGTERLAREAYQTVYGTFEFGAQLLLALAFTFFLVRDGARIRDAAIRTIPEHHRARAKAAASRGWHTLERYIVGITIISAINTVLTGIALLVLDIPMVVPLVLFTFVACYVPFVGTIVANLAGALIALAERGPTVALAFLGVGLAIELLESNVTQPVVQGRVMHLHPIVVLAAVTAGAVLLGLPGAFLAVPIVAVINAVVGGMREDRKESADASADAVQGA
ncbi:MAG: AI-2E family transporter, partial [Myxococcota bacterium]|nr:AI-2E family transporter [Myxococcota bacterium]